MSYMSCSTTVNRLLTLLELSVQVCFKDQTSNSLKGPYRNKIKGAYCLYVILSNFCSIILCNIFVVFGIFEICDFGPLNFLITMWPEPDYLDEHLNSFDSKCSLFKKELKLFELFKFLLTITNKFQKSISSHKLFVLWVVAPKVLK